MPQSTEATAAPVVTKVEQPNWWVGVTPDLMVLLSGHGLQATQVGCNLPDVVVEHTEATQRGEYL
ncbi:MAG TPA: cyclomaltodextrinase N-terminal domain-containing protein, partial [Candidatus Acidoferrum sp.]|nr:cyclomaltodextrinase N-terminal domain-containing protein [Candidatus Acidoferrum sp.]